MPSVFKNNEPKRVVLKADLSESPQPAFFVRRLTFGQMKAFMGLMNRLRMSDGDIDKTFDDLVDTLNDSITGWEHMGSFIYGQDKVEDFLSPSEVMELVMLVLNGSQVDSDSGN